MKTIRQQKGVFTGSVEELILRIGLCALTAWLLACGLAWLYARHYSVGVLKAVGSHALGGRAAGILAGLNAGLPQWLVVLVAFAMDTTVVLLLYPLAIYSYERRARGWFMRETFEPTLQAASTGRKKVRRWGVVGIIFFVWFPFYMTGPLVGSVIGYFLGLRAWANVTAVGVGTLLAIVSWSFVSDWLLGALKEVAKGLVGYLPWIVVLLVLVGVLVARILHRRRRTRTKKRERPPDGRGDRAQAPSGDRTSG